MIRKIIPFALIAMVASPVAAEWGTCSVTWAMSESISRLTSIARCSYLLLGVEDRSTWVRGEHFFQNRIVGACYEPGSCGTSFIISPYAASTTYTTIFKAEAQNIIGVVFDRIERQAIITTPAPERPRSEG